MEERICKYDKCKKKFKPKHSMAEYCSPECWEKQHGLYKEEKKKSKK